MAEELTPTAIASSPVPESDPVPQGHVSQNIATLPKTASDTASAKSASKPAGETEPKDTSDSNPSEITQPEAEVKEPQNALTRKFTVEEWKALKELRSDLPNVFAEAFPDKEGAESIPIKLWGITIDPQAGKVVDARVNVILMKFLRARSLNVTEARNMLVSTLRWRDTFKPEETVKEDFPLDIFDQLGHVYGHDRDGRPVTYNLYGGNKDLKAVFGDIPLFLRWRVSLMEKGIALLDFENMDQMVQIHDYEGVSLSSRDANSKNAASEATSIFTAHYPELLYKKFFVNVPTLMTWIFWVFKPLLSSQTIAKMNVVGSGPSTIGKAILPYVEHEQLPERYGGKAKAF